MWKCDGTLRRANVDTENNAGIIIPNCEAFDHVEGESELWREIVEL